MDFTRSESHKANKGQKKKSHHTTNNCIYQIKIVKPENWFYNKKAVASIFVESLYEKNKAKRGNEKQ